MLTILVGFKKETIETVDGRVCSVYPLIVVENGKAGCLQNRLDYSDVKKVEFRRLLRLVPFFTPRIRLTSAVERTVLHFLHTHHAKQNLSVDCYAFACNVNEVSDAPKKDFYKHWRNFRRLRPRRGDTIFLLHSPEDPMFRHAAVYIGWGLYLSVWGAGGDLEVATLKDMQKSFEAEKVVFVAPHKTAAVS